MPPTAALVTDVDAARTLVAGLATETAEVGEVLYLDPNWRLRGRWRFAGVHGGIVLPVREMIGRGLAMDARAVILAHNHPSGDASPSDDDLRVTSRLADILAQIQMPLLDHLIVTPGRVLSFREAKLL